MSENVGRCRAAVALLEAARGLVESASTEAGAALWESSLRDERTVLRGLERIQQRLVQAHDRAKVAAASTTTEKP